MRTLVIVFFFLFFFFFIHKRLWRRFRGASFLFWFVMNSEHVITRAEFFFFFPLIFRYSGVCYFFCLIGFSFSFYFYFFPFFLNSVRKKRKFSNSAFTHHNLTAGVERYLLFFSFYHSAGYFFFLLFYSEK